MTHSYIRTFVRTDLPERWQHGLQDSTTTSWGAGNLPANLLGPGSDRQVYATAYKDTLIKRACTLIAKIRVKHVYNAMLTSIFSMPRTFGDGAGARHAHLFAGMTPLQRAFATARAVRCVKHKAVPPEMTETAYRVAMSAFAFGPTKGHVFGRTECPCGSGDSETVEHTFWKCMRSRRVHETVLERWREVTGETKLRGSDGRVTLFGDRSGTWLDETEQGEFAGLEEPFAIIHKATLHVIRQERDRDARPKPRARRTAQQLCQAIERLVQRIVKMRWADARARRFHDEGRGAWRFRRRWEAPGLVKISADEKDATLIMFMRRETRDRWKHRSVDMQARRYRAQQHSPPERLPDNTISIYTDGSGDPREIGKPPPPAGYGFVAVRGGRDHKKGVSS